MLVSPRPDASAEPLPLPLVIQSLNVLAMDTCVLEDCIRAALMENPLLEQAPSYADGNAREYIFAQVQQEESLQDLLRQQVGCLRISPQIAGAADLLIDCLDDDGYLREDLTELSVEWKIPLKTLNRALAVVQRLEPAGVGCRNLSECLRLQLLALGGPNELALELVTNHLEEIAARSFSAGSYDRDELDKAIELIRTLSPRPCANLGKNTTRYIIPEIRIFRDQGGTIRAELINQPSTPVLSPLYKEYLKADSAEDRSYVRGQIQLAQNLIHSLSMRANTLHRIAQLLVERQSDFFLMGPDHQRVLSLSDAAETLGLSISTVSRAVSGKYAEFEGSVFPLRSLFCSNGAGSLSRTAIISRIGKLLAEDPSLRDSQLAVLLREQGIQISRRTVNKYRHMASNRNRLLK